jgi:hypothetical protein
LSILYNSPISYNEPNVGYSGSIIIHAPSFFQPLTINNVKVSFASYTDNSNATVVAVISYSYAPTGVLEVFTTDEQAHAIISVVGLNSGEIALSSSVG